MEEALARKGKGVLAVSSLADMREWADSNLLLAPQNIDDDVEVEKLFVIRNDMKGSGDVLHNRAVADYSIRSSLWTAETFHDRWHTQKGVF